MIKLYVVCGEPSGDLHAGNLLRQLRHTMPDIPLEVRGMGGDKLKAEGMMLFRHFEDYSFMGFVEVVSNLRKLLRLLADIKADINDYNPNAVLLVDYPGFNLRLAKYLKQRGFVVYYYIAPQVWAWKAGRVKGMSQHISRLFCILPFEPAFFAAHGMTVDYVGHPLLDAIDQMPVNEHSLPDYGKPILAILPGSRVQEIKRMLPTMLAAAAQFPDYQPVIAGMASRSAAFYQGFIKKSPAKHTVILSGQTYPLLQRAAGALVTSGTATLETALFGVPQVVCYAGGWLSYMIARNLVTVKYIALPNLIMNAPIVPELIQGRFTVPAVVSALNTVLTNRSAIIGHYQGLQAYLGGPGASARLAALLSARLKLSLNQ